MEEIIILLFLHLKLSMIDHYSLLTKTHTGNDRTYFFCTSLISITGVMSCRTESQPFAHKKKKSHFKKGFMMTESSARLESHLDGFDQLVL